MPGVVDVVPAARTVLVDGTPELDPDRLRAVRDGPSRGPPAAPAASPRTHEIRMDAGRRGPGRDRLALRRSRRPRSSRRSSSISFTVGFLGFSPGFAYLYGLPRAFHLPRRGTPRIAVPAGSVALAGPYVGIYPAATPGGWNLLGSTQRRLFDLRADPPFLFAPGDRVRFRL